MHLRDLGPQRTAKLRLSVCERGCSFAIQLPFGLIVISVLKPPSSRAFQYSALKPSLDTVSSTNESGVLLVFLRLKGSGFSDSPALCL